MQITSNNERVHFLLSVCACMQVCVSVCKRNQNYVRITYVASTNELRRHACNFQQLCTVLDTDNLHFSDEFLDFLAQADTNIHADALGFSARLRCDFRKIPCGRNLGRISPQIRAENG